MNETQDERLARLTELARAMWPNSDDLRVSPRDGAKPFAADVFLAAGDGSHYQLEFKTYHPLALDALEAALLTLTGERLVSLPALVASLDEDAHRMDVLLRATVFAGEQKARADAAEAKLAVLQANIGALAARWRAGIAENWEDYPVVELALDELSEAMEISDSAPSQRVAETAAVLEVFANASPDDTCGSLTAVTESCSYWAQALAKKLVQP